MKFKENQRVVFRADKPMPGHPKCYYWLARQTGHVWGGHDQDGFMRVRHENGNDLIVREDEVEPADPLKRYLLFGGDCFYAAGGWSDFVGSFDTVEEAKRAAEKKGLQDEWYQVVDLYSGVRVVKHNYSYGDSP